jgi:hypothetical protein
VRAADAFNFLSANLVINGSARCRESTTYVAVDRRTTSRLGRPGGGRDGTASMDRRREGGPAEWKPSCGGAP